MERRMLGSLAVSVSGLGCDNMGVRIDEARSLETVHAALDCGINHFDTADTYGAGRSEEILGRALSGCRDDVVIATKFGDNPPLPGVEVRPQGQLPGGRPELVRASTEASLRRLGTDRIDLLWLHAPDPSTPIGDTLAELDRLAAQGKVREIGCSNFSAEQIEEAGRVARELGLRPFVAVQNEYSLVVPDPEQEVLSACDRLGLAFVPYWPLASGILSGKYRRDEPMPDGTRLTINVPRYLQKFVTDELLGLVWQLELYAVERGHTLLELALSWLACNPSIASVIVGASTAEQVRQNARATVAWTLTDSERSEICELIARARA
jgi:aryl-alcohol dehydrogenase-like predicted oxidoreductase